MSVFFKLANVILQVDELAAEHPELYYRTNGAARASSFGCKASSPAGEGLTEGLNDPSTPQLASTPQLTLSARTDFLTYLNALSACKWRRYTGISRIHLRLTAAGVGSLRIEGIAVGAAAADRRTVASVEVSSTTPSVYDLEADITNEDLLGLVVEPAAGESLTIASAAWFAEMEPSAINPVHLALATTTFKKERYITANMSLVHRGIAAEGGPIADSFHMFVVDNGRTLDVDALDSDFVTIIPNPNVGGSGGFARGMMAAMDAPVPFTHVLVMDDDVRILPESIIRTFSLLSLVQGRYRDAFINGAMLSLEDPVRQYEDVSYVSKSANYFGIKPQLRVDRLEDVLENERIDVEVPHAYGAWWYSVLPMNVIREKGLPMPFFIRCDDVEFGMRNQPTYMTMGGICVWHESFEGRFRASVDRYQYIRNFLAMIAVDNLEIERVFTFNIARFVSSALRDFDYGSAELTLDGFEDYLKGPSFIEHADGAHLMAEKGARNERLVPVEELDKDVVAQAGVDEAVLSRTNLYEPRSPLRSLLRLLPHDRHYLSGFLVRGKTGFVVKNGVGVLDAKRWTCDTLVFLDPTRTKGSIRHMDRARFKAILKRERELFRRYRAEGKRVRQEWKAALPYLSSREFWEKYLKERTGD